MENIMVVVNYLKEEIIGFLNKFHKNVKIVEQTFEKIGTAAAVECTKILLKMRKF